MKNLKLIITSVITVTSFHYSAIAQSAIEHHVWQDARTFAPYSRTAEAITGKIKLSGNQEFATPGSKMTITFANGKKAQLTSVGASYRNWSDTNDKKLTAEIFKIAKDPGRLLNGNTLCGDNAKFIVFAEDSSFGTALLSMAVFSSKTPPKDIASAGICATFNYTVN
ncbi:hypothetical protein U2P60_19655 [Brucella sp. H1_1004]|uniref:hypothetical protein n=1 Tax=Brucella sp. H1_1004 TaxID=3110109 RepID=UPI0039B663B7